MLSTMKQNNIIARDKFAAANGWKASDKLFSLELLASGKKSGPETWTHPLHFDHVEYFRKDGIPVAVMSHNYGGSGEEALRRLFAAMHRTVDEHKLVLHVPYGGAGISWYYPLRTLPMCATRPDVESINWPSGEEAAHYAVAYFELARAMGHHPS